MTERPRRRLVPRLLLGGAAVVAVVVAVAGFLFVRSVQGPLDAANGYFGSLADRDYREAYSRLCDRTRDAVTQETYVSVTRLRLAGAFRIDDFAANPRVDVDGDRAEVDFSVSYDGGGNADVTLTLEKDDGDWKPCPDPDSFA